MKKLLNNKIFNKIGNILEVLLVVFAVLLCLIVLSQRLFSGNKSFFGYRMFNIITSSMQPELKVGDIILVKEIDYDKIKIGDNITYKGMSNEVNGKIITHKVKNIIDENGKKIFYTKGINTETVDPAVYEEQIYGVVQYKFVVLSFLHSIITTTPGFIFLIVVPLLYILIMEIRNMIVEKRQAELKEKLDKKIKENNK